MIVICQYVNLKKQLRSQIYNTLIPNKQEHAQVKDRISFESGCPVQGFFLMLSENVFHVMVLLGISVKPPNAVRLEPIILELSAIQKHPVVANLMGI